MSLNFVVRIKVALWCLWLLVAGSVKDERRHLLRKNRQMVAKLFYET